MRANSDKQILIDFDNPPYQWPSQDNFPLNEEANKVKEILLQDIDESTSYLIITGFTSLANIVEIFGVRDLSKKSIRILLGYEPDIKKRKRWKNISLSEEINEYWIDKGIDTFHGGMLIKTIEHIKSGNITFRIKEKLHAKIYVGDNHAVLGSSNFSKLGITTQKEANTRFHKDLDDNTRYDDTKQIAENFWEYGSEFDMVKLLKELLQKVPWEQALARAIAEIIEGNWISNYPLFQEKIKAANLWPYQISGLSKSLILLEKQGSLLVADPTGSGKTRMITLTVMSLIHNLWENGKRDHTNTLILCPKPIVENWEKEWLDLKFLNTSPKSIGLLQREGRNREKAIKALQIANILVLDEAHNFLSKKSNRSNAFDEHSADFVLLSTATPINKKANDLIRLIELLGPDNLNDIELEQLKDLYKYPIKEYRNEDLNRLNGFIQKFILRRTKKQLNKLIDQNPDAYRNKLGKAAKFPRVKNKTYSTGESDEDKLIAKEINRLAQQLKGIIYLQTFKLPLYIDLSDDKKIESYFERRLKSANAFSRYHIRNSMRSSRVALIEHISGTKEAKKWAGISDNKSETGNILKKLNNLYDKSLLPKNDYKDYVPDWLKNIELYKKEVKQEIEIYTEILKLIKSMSDKREVGKARQILKLYNEHQMVLAFDTTVLTLYYIRILLKKLNCTNKIHLVTGSSESQRLSLQEAFGIDSKVNKGIALCSDVMSEGVNLQKARALVQLDMPTVLRLAEQRVGRLHRMDSPHQDIQVYWSKDTEDFAMKSDKRLIKTSILTDKLIGGNLELPDDFVFEENQLFTADDMIKEFKTFDIEDKEWEGLHDAFDPIYKLKEGDTAIITEKVYNHIKNTKASIRCRVSFVSSQNEWAFICTLGSNDRSPTWLYIEDTGNVYNEFPVICNLLRKNLKTAEDKEWNQEVLDKFINIYKKNERDSLPNKKRRVLNVVEHLLEKQFKFESKEKNPEMLDLIKKLQQLFYNYSDEDMSIDFLKFADEWLEVLKPLLKEKKLHSRRKELITLYDLKTKWVKRYFDFEQLWRIYDNVPLVDKLENRIASCIIGAK